MWVTFCALSRHMSLFLTLEASNHSFPISKIILPSSRIIVSLKAFFWLWNNHTNLHTFKVLVLITKLFYYILLDCILCSFHAVISQKSHGLIILRYNLAFYDLAKLSKFFTEVIFRCLSLKYKYSIRQVKDDYFGLGTSLDFYLVLVWLACEILIFSASGSTSRTTHRSLDIPALLSISTSLTADTLADTPADTPRHR